MAPAPPPPVSRRPIHLRRITCEGYERGDGLYDIVGTLIDTKPFALALQEKTVNADEAIHHMTVCLTVDRDRLIRDVVARTVHGPHAVCGAITQSYRQLVGERIQPGFTHRVIQDSGLESGRIILQPTFEIFIRNHLHNPLGISQKFACPACGPPRPVATRQNPWWLDNAPTAAAAAAAGAHEKWTRERRAVWQPGVPSFPPQI